MSASKHGTRTADAQVRKESFACRCCCCCWMEWTLQRVRARVERGCGTRESKRASGSKSLRSPPGRVQPPKRPRSKSGLAGLRRKVPAVQIRKVPARSPNDCLPSAGHPRPPSPGRAANIRLLLSEMSPDSSAHCTRPLGLASTRHTRALMCELAILHVARRQLLPLYDAITSTSCSKLVLGFHQHFKHTYAFRL